VVNKVMPDRRSIFGNWADYCSVEMEKLLIWNSRSLKLLQEIEPFASFVVYKFMRFIGSSEVINEDYK